MTEIYDNTLGFEKLSENAIVYRALLRQKWIDEESEMVTPDAFFLRKIKNEQGLSVNIADVFSPEQCAARFNNCYGVASLVVYRIRELGLDVVRDSLSHANIIGLPYREDNRVLAERLAELLAKHSHIEWRP